MKFSILHISDIHKNPGVGYDALVQSLMRDFYSYTSVEGVLPPSFIVVSGDLIQGAYTDNEIRDQYSEVELFLNDICDFILQGDRSRLIIVPGNHDVNRSITKASMHPSSKNYNTCKGDFFRGSTDIRWNWDDHQFYEITNPNTYKNRFNLFVDFYNRFFAGYRQYPENPEEQAYVVINDAYNICFACFNSCHHLDHLCDTGLVSDNALISIGKELNESYHSGYLIVAVWHHHFYGRPMETNYMDRAFLNDLLSYNIHMGLFGHQHFTQVAEEYSDLLLLKEDSTQKLLLISSGTLFGGKKVLPENCKRQYNVIEVDLENGNARIDVNIRQDFNLNPNNKIPHWRQMPLSNTTNKVHYDIKLKHLSMNDLILRVERKAKLNGDFKAACESIKQIEHQYNVSLRSIFMSYLKEVRDYEYIYNNIGEITSIEDATLKIIAAHETANSEYKKEVLTDERIIRLNDPFLNSLLSTLK